MAHSQTMIYVRSSPAVHPSSRAAGRAWRTVAALPPLRVRLGPHADRAEAAVPDAAHLPRGHTAEHYRTLPHTALPHTATH